MLSTFSPLIISIHYGYPLEENENLVITLWKRQSVSESVCLFVCLFPNSSETGNPSELKFLGMIPLEIGKVLG